MRRRYRRILVALVASAAAAWLGERAVSFAFPYPLAALARHGESRRVESRDGTLLRVTATPAGERLLRIGVDAAGTDLEHALLASEDRRFYAHSGVDARALLRAAVTSLAKRRVVSGASTLTMQLARIIEPRGRSFASKAIEMFRARQIERLLTKRQILEHYINLVPLGGTLRGFEAAARYWFGKRARDLAAHEAATLVAMLPAPSRRSPRRAPRLLLFHRNRVLDAMRSEGWLSERRHAAARRAPLGARPHSWPFRATHACDWLLATHTATCIRSHLEVGLQEHVERCVRRLRPPAIDGVAVVVLDRSCGELRALVGSRAWRDVQLNAALRRRPAGSTLKPFLFALAAELGVAGPDSLVDDSALCYAAWRPRNFDHSEAGSMRASDALIASRNLPAVRLLEAVGSDRFRDSLAGFSLHFRPEQMHLDAALGTCGVTPLGLARAYRMLASSDPVVGGISLRRRREVLAVLARGSPNEELLGSRSISWKTGTSSGRRDAWSVGVTPSSVIVAWLGNLRGRAAPELVGGRAATALMAAVANVAY